MIKKFHQINEEMNILKDVNFFKEYFIEFLDEYHDYSIEIIDQKYVQDGNSLKYSNFPKKDFLPYYVIYLKDRKEGEDINSLLDFSERCKIVAQCLKRMESDFVIIDVSTKFSIGSYISFEIKIYENLDIPDEDLPDEFFEEFHEMVSDIIGNLGYRRLFQVIKNEEENKLELIGNCMVNQLDALIRELSRSNSYINRKYRLDHIIFDIEVIKRKNKDNHLDLKNPRLIKGVSRDED
jgi:hypothetical protein